jgi:uncharacterized membrane protein YphA (DoxX/SURF4 family)
MKLKPVIEARPDVGLLILRVGAGLSLFLLFGWPKLKAANQYWHSGSWMFVDFNRKVGLAFRVLIALYQTANESIGALLVAIGLFSRVAACSLAIGFGAATFLSLRAGEDAWLTASFYCLMFASIALTGSGAFSIDRVVSNWRCKKTNDS